LDHLHRYKRRNAAGMMRRGMMKTRVLSAAAALSRSAGVVHANDEGGVVADTLFTGLPGVVAPAPVQNAPSAATARNGQVHVFSARSAGGTWLFTPHEGNG
jgi:hypothetical protein